MNLQSRRCACGAVFQLATLRSVDTECVPCQRKRAEAVMEARKDEQLPWVAALEKERQATLERQRLGVLAPELTPVDLEQTDPAWAERAREVLSEQRELMLNSLELSRVAPWYMAAPEKERKP